MIGEIFWGMGTGFDCGGCAVREVFRSILML